MGLWDDARCVHVTAGHCPHCHCLKYVRVRSEANGDGTVTRKCVCERCSRRFKLVIELPETGNSDEGV